MSRNLVTTFLAVGLALATSATAQWVPTSAGIPNASPLATNSTGTRIWGSNPGVWLSENSGASWQPASARFAPGGGVWLSSLFALDANADTLIVGGNYRSETRFSKRSFDGGLTWSDLPADPQFTMEFAVSPFAHNLWFYTDEYHVAKSEDFGQTWTTLPLEVSHIGSVYLDSQHDSTVFVLGSPYWRWGYFSAGLWRSDDLGATWQAAMSEATFPGEGSGDIFHLLRLSNGDLLASGAYYPDQGSTLRSLWLSIDDGQTWSFVEGTGALWNWTPLAEDPSIAGRLYGAGGWYSEDYGRTWQAFDNIPGSGTLWPFYMNPFSGRMYVNGDSGTFRSEDHGATWAILQPLPIGGPWGKIIVDDDALLLTSYSDGSAWLTNAPFEAWQSLPPPASLGDSLVVDTWLRLKVGATVYAMCTFYDPDGGLQPFSSRVARTTDYGQSWTFGPPIDHNFEGSTGNAIETPTGTRWLEKPSWDSLIASTDLGATWQTIGDFSSDAIFHIVQTEAVIFVGAGDPVTSRMWIRQTSDLGATWQFLGQDLLDGSTLALLQDTVYASRDGHCVAWVGGSWETRGLLPQSHSWSGFHFIGLNGDVPMLVGAMWDSTWLWVSTDYGTTWQARHYELPFEEQCSQIGYLTYDPYRERLWASSGTGMYYLPVTELSADGPLQFMPADYTLLAVYPNPFNSSTKIRFDLLKREQVKVAVYDVLGREVKTVVDDLREAGRHEVSLEMRDAASGLYFVRVQTAEQTKTVKLALLK